MDLWIPMLVGGDEGLGARSRVVELDWGRCGVSVGQLMTVVGNGFRFYGDWWSKTEDFGGLRIVDGGLNGFLWLWRGVLGGWSEFDVGKWEIMNNKD